MSSKSKEVRIEQRRILEKKLDFRLQKLAQKGISKEKAVSDPLVKKLKSKIRETNIRISVFDRNAAKTQELVVAREKKLAEKTAPKVEAAPAAAPAESKPKKKAAAADKEPKKKAAAPAPAEGEAPKKPRKKKEEVKEE